jgi:outer membrane phospholipase A
LAFGPEMVRTDNYPDLIGYMGYFVLLEYNKDKPYPAFYNSDKYQIISGTSAMFFIITI